MFENKKILILGLARSGYAAAKYLINHNNEVILNDNKDEEKQDKNQVEELKALGVKLVFGSHPDELLDDSFDYLIKNPGVPIDHKYVLKARTLGVEVINEAEMAFRLLPEGVNLMSITGTNGKTTTTTLTYLIMKEYYKDKVYLTGNIGYPMIDLIGKVKPGDYIVMEVSCQQLENMSEYKPNVGLITNFSPAHIDFLKSYENYKRVKAKIFANQTINDVAILNADNEDVLNETKDIKSTKKYFSSKKKVDGTYLVGDDIYYYDEYVLSRSDIKIAGMHNVENVMAATTIVKEYNVPSEVIKKVVSEFNGVEHRLEFSGEVNTRRFYNDTEATNIKCTQIALSSFEQDTFIILGGMERGQSFDDLTPYMKNVKGILAIGTCRNRVKEFGDKLGIPTIVHEFLKDGFKELYDMSTPNSVILLSPGSASWDQYKECEVRGAEFKDLVKKLNE
ncbi:MAG: UDP-N-acetylmuramoyl-L-alanine--D-glutamate ligase [Bacilli bacterium]|nr:UDP-N-acetylmuramoyl-L-alanine--D-glutamate ligase [Bacilli bacterium]